MMDTSAAPRWTPEEDELAIALAATTATTSELDGKIPGRTGKALRSRVRYLGLTPDARYLKNSRRGIRIRPSAGRPQRRVGVPPEISESLELDRLRRENAPRSLTAILMSDPEPGRQWPDGRSAAQVQL